MKNVMSIFMAIALFSGFYAFSQEKKPFEQRIEMLVKKLSLSEEQSQKIKALTSESKEEFETHLKEILSPNQWDKYEHFKIKHKLKPQHPKKKEPKACCKHEKDSEDKKTCCKNKKNKTPQKACCKSKKDKNENK